MTRVYESDTGVPECESWVSALDLDPTLFSAFFHMRRQIGSKQPRKSRRDEDLRQNTRGLLDDNGERGRNTTSADHQIPKLSFRRLHEVSLPARAGPAIRVVQK